MMFIYVKCTIVYIIFIYFLTPMCSKDNWTATSTYEPTKKEHYGERQTEQLIKKPPKMKGIYLHWSCSHFYQIIGKHSARKEFQTLTVVPYQNKEHKSHKDKVRELIQPIPINTFQSNTYKTDLNWSHFHHAQSVQGNQFVQDQWFQHSYFCS